MVVESVARCIDVDDDRLGMSASVLDVTFVPMPDVLMLSNFSAVVAATHSETFGFGCVEVVDRCE